MKAPASKVAPWVAGLIAFVIVAAIVFLGCAFVELDVNPAHWSQDSRATATAFAGLFGGFIASVTILAKSIR